MNIAHHRKTHGFTLIELSIVLVIIGLIIGGVLVGRDLIRQAELRSIVSDTEKIQTAYNAFRLKYNCLPGDCPNASTFISGATDGNGNGWVGTWELGTPSIDLCQFGTENYAAWKHLADVSIFPSVVTGSDPGGLSCDGACPLSSTGDYYMVFAMVLYSGGLRNSVMLRGKLDPNWYRSTIRFRDSQANGQKI